MSVEELLALATAAVLTVERIAQPPAGVSTNQPLNAQGDSVNNLDLDAHHVVSQLLERAGVCAVSEEDQLPPTVQKNLFAYIDPIDGSKNWESGRGPYGPSICILDRQGPLVAAVLDLRSGRLVTAVRNAGLHVVREPKNQPETTRSYIIGGDYLRDSEQPPVCSGATAHDLCSLALQQTDVYMDLTNTVYPWDYLGGLLILQEAGGHCEDRYGRPLVPEPGEKFTRQLLAIGPGLRTSLRAAVKTKDSH
jgi:fructose-1,6-bisphosphatase/inositol monophosphatase family enzyme